MFHPNMLPVDMNNNIDIINNNNEDNFNINGGNYFVDVPLNYIDFNNNNENNFNINGGNYFVDVPLNYIDINNNENNIDINGGDYFVDVPLNNIDINNNENNFNINGGDYFVDVQLNNQNPSQENQEKRTRKNQNRRVNKKKTYHRHTQHQIQQLDAFFKECPHPDEKQRKALSRQLGLDHLRIKFWFQNKRTQNKNQLGRQENSQLRTENDKLRFDNYNYREAIANASCFNCGVRTSVDEMSLEEQHIRLENARLQEEINKISRQIYTGKSIMTYPDISLPPVPPRTFEFGIGNIGRDIYGNSRKLWRPFVGLIDSYKPMIIEVAVEAMDQLMVMAQVGEPLWMTGANGMSLALNLEEYKRTFHNGHRSIHNEFRTEASRETAVVLMNHGNIVEWLMDVDKWSTIFSGMIARAMTHQVLSTEVTGNSNEVFQLMSAEYQVLSPLVRTRQSYFVRYSKQYADNLWAVVDVSVDHLVPNVVVNCRRRPSGCLIQEIQNGYSKVTWVEHVEVKDRGGIHNLYEHLITTGQALGASRWIATLNRECERLASIMTPTFPLVEPADPTMIKDQGKAGILKLTERMARSFYAGVTTSNAEMWNTLTCSIGDELRVMARKSVNDPGRPSGVALCAATSFWLPNSPNNVFNFLIDDNNRTKWDVLTGGDTSQKVSEIVNGSDSRNCVSLFQGPITNERKMMMIQETYTDPTASYLIYAPVDVEAIEMVLAGGDPDYVALLPSGLAILPDGTANFGVEGGSLVNISFQILIEPLCSSSILTFSSVATIETLVLATVQNLKALFQAQALLVNPFGN